MSSSLITTLEENETRAILAIAPFVTKKKKKKKNGSAHITHALSPFDGAVEISVIGRVQDLCLHDLELRLDLSQLHDTLRMLPHLEYLDLDSS